MTTIHTVSDNDLGKVARKIHKLMNRILEGSTEQERALFFLDLANMGIPKVRRGKWADGTYALQCEWIGDDPHYDLATITFEAVDEYILPEHMLDSDVPQQEKKRLIERLRMIIEAQVSFFDLHKPYKMLRVYRVLSTRYFGFNPRFGANDTLERLDTVDMHLVLKPLFDFDENGKPIPCVVG